MVSIIIAAHNEQAVLGNCLDALLEQPGADSFQIVVSANGCSDRTAQIAADRMVTVVDRAEPGKVAALNAAEEVTSAFPRVYLDADIVVPLGGLDQIIDALRSSSKIAAAVPARRIDTVGRPLMVRAYFAINERLPVFRDGLFGRGMIALTEQARGRFDQFPAMIADDLFLDSLFSADEKQVVSDVTVVVAAPYRTADLLNRLIRVRRGNTQLRKAAASGHIPTAVRPSHRWSWLRDVVLPQPRLVFAAIPYVLITLSANVLARYRRSSGWGHDLSTRSGVARQEGDQAQTS